MKNILNFFVVIFIAMLLCRLFVDIHFKNSIRIHNLIPYLVLISLFYFRSKIFWLMGILYFIYGIYEIWLRKYVEYPSDMLFTLPLVEFFCGDGEGYSSKGYLPGILFSFPSFFYPFAIIFFLLKSTRNNYFKNVSPYA